MSAFTLQVAVSFVVGGLCIAFQSLIAERVQPSARGLILTIPTTLALGFFFVGFAKTPADVVEVTRFFPAALVPDYVFVVLFAFLVRYRLSLALIGSYAAWAAAAFLVMMYPPHSFAVAACVYLLPIVFVLYAIVKRLPQVTAITPVPMNVKHIVMRSMIGGCVIALVVILSKTLGNIWASLFSAFPAAWSATLILYYWYHGREIIPSVVKSLFFPGVFGYLFYALVASVAYPHYGIWVGTLLCYGAVIPFYVVVNKLRAKYRLNQTAKMC